MQGTERQQEIFTLVRTHPPYTDEDRALQAECAIIGHKYEIVPFRCSYCGWLDNEAAHRLRLSLSKDEEHDLL